MRTRAALGAVVTVAGLLLVLLATRSGRTRDISAHDLPYRVPASATANDHRPVRRQPSKPARNRPAPKALPGWIRLLVDLAFVLVLAVVAGLVIAYVIALIRRFERRPRAPQRPDAHGDWERAPADVARTVADAVAAGLARLDHGAGQEAIVACWLRLEQAAAAAGVPRRRAETAAELTARVLAAHRVDPATLRELAELYREARFSTHPMDEAARDRARAALERVQAELVAP